jgi:hypothetical protein
VPACLTASSCSVPVATRCGIDGATLTRSCLLCCAAAAVPSRGLLPLRPQPVRVLAAPSKVRFVPDTQLGAAPGAPANTPTRLPCMQVPHGDVSVWGELHAARVLLRAR